MNDYTHESEDSPVINITLVQQMARQMVFPLLRHTYHHMTDVKLSDGYLKVGHSWEEIGGWGFLGKRDNVRKTEYVTLPIPPHSITNSELATYVAAGFMIHLNDFDTGRNPAWLMLPYLIMEDLGVQVKDAVIRCNRATSYLLEQADRKQDDEFSIYRHAQVEIDTNIRFMEVYVVHEDNQVVYRGNATDLQKVVNS